MLPFLVHRLGDSVYGVWIIIVSVVGYGTLLDLGVRTAIVKYVSQHYASGDRDRLLRLFNTSLLAYAAIGTLVFVVAAGVVGFLPRWFTIPPELGGDLQLVVLVMVLDLALKFPSSVFEGFLTGLQRYEIANAIVIATNVVRAALIVVIVGTGGELLALAAVVLGSDFLMSAATAVACLRLLPWLSFSRRYLNLAVLRDLYTFGLWSTVVTLAARVLYESDSILIGMFLPAAAITHFAVANNLVKYLRQVAYGFGNVFAPAASDIEARNDHKSLARLLTQGTLYAFAVILAPTIVLALCGIEFLTLWMGPRYAAESGNVLVVLLISQVAVMAQFPGGAVLYGLNRHRQLAFILLGEAICKVILSVVLLPSHGIIGVAIGTAVPELIASLVLMPILLTRSTQVSLIRYFREAFLPVVVPGLALAGCVMWLNMALGSGTWVLLISKVMIGLAVYSTICLFTCFNKQQRGAIGSAFWRRLPKIA
jgi:O-antigen/teichoic acid export membrane protein